MCGFQRVAGSAYRVVYSAPKVCLQDGEMLVLNLASTFIGATRSSHMGLSLCRVRTWSTSTLEEAMAQASLTTTRVDRRRAVRRD